MNKPKISVNQVFWMTFSIEMAMTLYLTQSLVIHTAKQDAWMSFLIGGVIACGITLLSVALARLYPDQTLVEFSRTILGRWLGKIIVVPFLAMWIFISSTLLRQFSDFFQMIMFDQTPTSVLMLMMMLIVSGLVWTGGIASIARCSQIVGPIIMVIVVLIICLSFNNFEFEQILPVFSDSGVGALIRGSLTPASVFGDAVFLLMLTKFMENPRQGTKKVVWGVAVVSVISSVLTLTALSIFGPALASKMLFPTFEMIRYVSLMEFIQNIEIFSTVIWFFSVFIKLSVYLFSTCYGISQWLGLKHWTRSIWVIAPAVFLIAWKFPQTGLYASKIQVQLGLHYFMPIVLTGIPLLLWIVGTVRKRSRHTRHVDP
ncbi:GerAB/ArcD/ProY family transporter [Paenibacillus sp. FJAT-27812]|uniref:GerAB/ArcD/ProY family transporter n=1 Tax=Paenibacillus sp. FJAT-27812 TaxID=1684143 RepID=UPI0006A79F1A|nr:endospore germination permease [Paenibacillus sp. FJAT-27812]